MLVMFVARFVVITNTKNLEASEFYFAEFYFAVSTVTK